MATVRVGFIGTGEKKPKPGLDGYFMAYRHAPGYKLLPECELVACADLVEANARAFATEFGVSKVYTDYHEMLREENLDIVSICTWPKEHARIVLDCLAADLPAIHCEKPMALDFGACREMVAAAKRSKTKLTFNHQRRFGAPIRGLRRLIETNVLGEILRMDALCGDLYDGGCHWVDMLTYMNGQHPAEWVMGQVDGREIRYAFGAPSEYQGVYQWKYANGVVAHMETGSDASEWGPSFRITGTEGVAEVPWTPTDGYMLRYSRYDEAGWIKVDCEGEHLHGPGYHERAIADVVDCLQTGRTSELCAENQLMSIEIVFGCYESARRRGRIDLPLDITDNPLLAMIESGQLSPTR